MTTEEKTSSLTQELQARAERARALEERAEVTQQQAVRRLEAAEERERQLEKKRREREEEQARLKGRLKATEEELESQKKELVCATLSSLFGCCFEVLCWIEWHIVMKKRKGIEREEEGEG